MNFTRNWALKTSFALTVVAALFTSISAFAAAGSPNNGTPYQATPAQIAACPAAKRAHITSFGEMNGTSKTYKVKPKEVPMLFARFDSDKNPAHQFQIDYKQAIPQPVEGWFVCGPVDSNAGGGQD